MSPTKAGRSSVNTSTVNLASDSRREPYAGSSMRSPPTSPTTSIHTQRTGRLVKEKWHDLTPSIPPTPSFSFLSVPDAKEGKGEGGFWTLGRWKGGNSNKQPSNSLAAGGSTDNPGRRSMAVVDSARLAINGSPRHARRVSSGARLASESSKQPEMQDNGKSQEHPLRSLAEAQRVDSGLGRLSAESVKAGGEPA